MRKTYRIQFKFWLDVNSESEFKLAEYIVELKKSRTFIKTVRDALRLIKSLREGDKTILQQMFPFAINGVSDSGTVPLLRASEPAADAFSTIEIKQAVQDENEKPTWNFMISTALSVYGNCDNLPEEIYEYGIQKGLITRPKKQKTEERGPKKMDVPQFDVPQFDEQELDLIL